MEEIEKTLEEIKRLIILRLYKDGATTSVIGELLGVSSRTIERILPKAEKRKNKKKK